jgi:hypothetical protein
MTKEEVIAYLKENTEPLGEAPDGVYYRASVTLRDDTLLPCVLFCNPKYNTTDNCVHHTDIAKIEQCRFALPADIKMQITSETSMLWTAFILKFKDGRMLSFGTSWHVDFFNLLDTFSFLDVIEIIPHAYLLKTGGIYYHQSSQDRAERFDKFEKCYGDKPFFECYIDNL